MVLNCLHGAVGSSGWIVFAWNRGCKKVMVEINSKLAHDVLQKGLMEANDYYSLVLRIKEFLYRDWLHVYRESNCVADRMAWFTDSLMLGLYVYDFLTPGLLTVVLQELVRVPLPRLVLAWLLCSIFVYKKWNFSWQKIGKNIFKSIKTL